MKNTISQNIHGVEKIEVSSIRTRSFESVSFLSERGEKTFYSARTLTITLEGGSEIEIILFGAGEKELLLQGEGL